MGKKVNTSSLHPIFIPPHSVHNLGLNTRSGSETLTRHGADSGVSTEFNLPLTWPQFREKQPEDSRGSIGNVKMPPVCRGTSLRRQAENK